MASVYPDMICPRLIKKLGNALNACPAEDQKSIKERVGATIAIEAKTFFLFTQSIRAERAMVPPTMIKSVPFIAGNKPREKKIIGIPTKRLDENLSFFGCFAGSVMR